MISVIVPVYRVEKYLAKCIKSIQNQTYNNLEIILVDDGSPDRCGEICDGFAKKDERIKVIHQKNGGLSSARNTGLDYAKGDYITFVDSDDTIEPQMIEDLWRMLQENADADISICGHRVVFENSDTLLQDNDLHIRGKLLNKEELWQEVFGKLNNAVWNKMYRSTILTGLRFPEGIIHGEDLLFNLEYLIKCKKGVITDVPLYNYLKREGSITVSEFSENKFFEIEAKDRALEIVEHYMPKQTENARKYCFRARMNVVRAIYKSRKEDTYKEFLVACKLYVKENYSTVKKTLKLKEKVEYGVLTMCPFAYKMITSKRRER